MPSAAAARTPRSGWSRWRRRVSRASLPRAWRSASRTAGSTRGSSSFSIACRIPTLISSPSAAEGRGERRAHPPDGVRVQSPRGRGRSPRGRCGRGRRGRRRGSRGRASPTQGDEARAQAGVGRAARRERAGLVAHHVARGGQHRRGGRGAPPSPDRAERAQGVQPPPSRRGRGRGAAAASTDEASLSAPRPRAARARERGSSEASAATSTGRSAGLSRRIATHVAAHQSKRGWRRRAARGGRPGTSLSRARANSARRCSTQGSSGSPGLVAAHGDAALIVLGSASSTNRAISARRPRVADPAEGLRRPRAHRPRRSRRGRRRSAIDGAPGRRRGRGRRPPSADLDLLVVHELDEGRHERGVGRRGRRRARRGVSRRGRGRAGAAPARRRPRSACPRGRGAAPGSRCGAGGAAAAGFLRRPGGRGEGARRVAASRLERAEPSPHGRL